MKIKILKKCTFKRGGTAVPGAIAVVLALALTFSACSESTSGGAASSGNLSSGAVSTARRAYSCLKRTRTGFLQ